MPALEYSNVTAKITSVTPLSEKHGNKRVPAQSIIIKVTLINRRLDFFDPDLRHAFYKVPDGTEPVPTLGIDPDDLEGLTEKRFPWMTQDIEVERELTGHVLTIDYGLGDAKSNIELDAKKIDNFKLGIRDHGLFELSHRFIVHPDTLEKGRIEELLQQEIKLHLRGPTSVQGELPIEEKRGRGRPKKTAAEKVGGDDDPFANTDIPPLQPEQTDDDAELSGDEQIDGDEPNGEPEQQPDPAPEKPKKARKGGPQPDGSWPFPSGVRP
ncbi:hypothetical protein SAMN05445504_2418 [Burkholderia sp. CF099]|nr:hypothetical protein SAMN05445504_2418 [Burkholderia sp. CF099]